MENWVWPNRRWIIYKYIRIPIETDIEFQRACSGSYTTVPMCTGTDIYVDTNKILVALGKNMRLEWPVYAFSASVFFRICPKCAVTFPWNWCNRSPVCSTYHGLRLGCLDHVQTKSCPRTTCLHYVQYVRGADALTRQALYELRRRPWFCLEHKFEYWIIELNYPWVLESNLGNYQNPFIQLRYQKWAVVTKTLFLKIIYSKIASTRGCIVSPCM
jgi:hypothetical protein